MTGIVTLALVPLRATNDDLSEMTSQLLFGEQVEIIEMLERWLFVRNLSDNYTGWADRKMIKILSPEQTASFSGISPYCVSTPILACKNTANETVLLPAGSLLPHYSNGKCTIVDEVFTFESNQDNFSESDNAERFTSLAKQFLNAPYLWGGKTIMGIDCAGLVQVVYSICGIFLPRDASQQVEFGEVIDFLSEAKAGDLAYFENSKGEIIHVGIMLNSHQIIHASGCVKIEQIDYQGITSKQTGEYTHKLRVIKRII